VAVYESQTATLAAHTPKPSYHNTKDKLVVSKSTLYTEEKYKYIGVNGIPYALKFMYTTCNQSF
jgi:hypothetical protein